MRGLHPQSDLRFLFDNQAGNGKSKRRGEIPFNTEEENCNPLPVIGLHLCGMQIAIREKLDLMGQAILEEDWIRFDTLATELRELKGFQPYLDVFAKEQVKSAVAGNIGEADYATLRRRMLSAGATEKALDKGHQEGIGALHTSPNPSR